MKDPQRLQCQQKPVQFGPKHYENGELSPQVQKLLADTYVKNEIIVFFPRQPNDPEIREVEAGFNKAGYKIKRKIKCDNCDIPIQLWQGENLHTAVHVDGVVSGSGPSNSNNVGEKYCLNFKNIIPKIEKNDFKAKTPVIDKTKNKIVVAVLDTGIDNNLIGTEYLFNSSDASKSACYGDVKSGWNFTEDASEDRIGNHNFLDDNEGKHGTLVTQFIINQFENSKKNRVEILPLKTHDKNGVGNLFRTICAIHFAIARKVDIINASWGLYYYGIEPIPYLKELITDRLRQERIIFVAAAGNIDETQDSIAKKLYAIDPGGTLTPSELRNLEIHKFYPANLSRPFNTVITSTTTDGKVVSPRQNYSNEMVDLGIIADKPVEGMSFNFPFVTSSGVQQVPGSSFAAAITTGIIGAYCPASLFRNHNAAHNIKKVQFFKFLKSLAAGQAGKIETGSSLLTDNYIIEGACTKKP